MFIYLGIPTYKKKEEDMSTSMYAFGKLRIQRAVNGYHLYKRKA